MILLLWSDKSDMTAPTQTNNQWPRVSSRRPELLSQQAWGSCRSGGAASVPRPRLKRHFSECLKIHPCSFSWEISFTVFSPRNAEKSITHTVFTLSITYLTEANYTTGALNGYWTNAHQTCLVNTKSHCDYGDQSIYPSIYLSTLILYKS